MSLNHRTPSSNWVLCLASWMTSAWPCVTHISRGSPAIRQTGCRRGRQNCCCPGRASTGESHPSSRTSWWGILIGRRSHNSSGKKKKVCPCVFCLRMTLSTKSETFISLVLFHVCFTCSCEKNILRKMVCYLKTVGLLTWKPIKYWLYCTLLIRKHIKLLQKYCFKLVALLSLPGAVYEWRLMLAWRLRRPTGVRQFNHHIIVARYVDHLLIYRVFPI